MTLEEESKPPVGPEPTHVVGVGASAGGLESLERFFGALPAASGMAFVVIQHLAPDHKSLMSELLRKHTAMSVQPATHGGAIEPNHVYLIPPGQNLEIREGKLVLTQRMDHPRRRPNYAVDQFFCSLALECTERAVGVVLSGTGSDGSHGATAIKAAGGLVLAEDPDTAKFGSMPQSVIDTGAVSAILPATKLPAEILRHVGLLSPEIIQPKEGLEKIISLVSEHTGINFETYKRTTVGRRVERRRITTDSNTLDDYADLLVGSAAERSILGRDLLVGVTAFFRDPKVFEALPEHLEPLLTQAAARRDRTFRGWVAACSTGEEAYSLAMACNDIIERVGLSVNLKIFATDVNDAALSIAARGRYPFSINANMTAQKLDRYFVSESDAYQAQAFLRESIVFARHDLLRDPPFTKVDFLSCRNVLIYFAAEAQRRATSVFHFALRPGGVLLLGTSETLGEDGHHFRTLDERNRIYEMSAKGPPAHLLGHMAQPELPGSSERVATPDIGRLHADRSSRLLEATLQRLGVAALILNHEGELAYAFGDAAGQLRVPQGRAGWKAADLLPTEISVIVSSAVDQVQESGQEIVVKGANFEINGSPRRADVRAVPLGVRSVDAGYAVFFEGWNDTDASQPAEMKVDDAVRSRITQLEEELYRTRARLQTAVEELEASNEELQATNEELVSSNEELQSTNEELQSLNEELHTVNAELQSKVEELSILSADLGNLLRTMDSGLLFLDMKGRVRRFNDAVRTIMPLVPHDVGRDISDIAHNLVDIDLAREVSRVVETNVGYEREVTTHDGRSMVVTLQPFETNNFERQGVVMTATDVTRLAHTNARLQVYSRLVEQSPALSLIADAAGCIEYANASYADATGMTGAELRGLDMRSLLSDRNTDEIAAGVRAALDGGEPWSGRVWLKTATQPLEVRSAIYPIRGSTGAVTHIAQTVELVD